LLDALAPLVVKLTVVVDQPGAEVFIDDVRVGTTPLAAPVTVDTGQRRVVARKPHFRDATQVVPVGGGATARVELTLAPGGS
jgi:hypothetical protein